MPGNVVGTTNADVIAQEAITQLTGRLPILKQIASDHSAENAKFGEKVIIHEVQSTSAEEFVPTTGYVAKDRTLVDIPVTINKHKHHTYSVSVQEASSSRVDLIKRFGLNAAYSLGSAIVADLAALMTAGNFTNKTTKALGAGLDGFDRKVLLQAGAALSKRGLVPFDRFALLNAEYFASLFMDESLLNLLVLSGQKVVEGNAMPMVHNFGISEFVDLASPAGENLVGFCGGRTALGFATRIPDDPGAGFSNVKISSVTDDQTGISIQVREWYNADLGKFNRTYTMMYGVGVGQAAAGQRIVSA